MIKIGPCRIELEVVERASAFLKDRNVSDANYSLECDDEIHNYVLKKADEGNLQNQETADRDIDEQQEAVDIAIEEEQYNVEEEKKNKAPAEKWKAKDFTEPNINWIEANVNGLLNPIDYFRNYIPMIFLSKLFSRRISIRF